MGCGHSTANEANAADTSFPTALVDTAEREPSGETAEATANDGAGYPNRPGATESRGPQDTPAAVDGFDDLRTNGGRDSNSGLNPFASPPVFREPSAAAFDFYRTSDFLDLTPASAALTNTPASLSHPQVFGLPELTPSNLAAHDAAESRRLRRSRNSGRPRVAGEPRCWAEVLADWFDGVAGGLSSSGR